MVVKRIKHFFTLNLMTKFIKACSVFNIKNSKKLFNKDNAASILAVHSVGKAPRLSLRKKAIPTGISKYHLQRIFKKNKTLLFKP